MQPDYTYNYMPKNTNQTFMSRIPRKVWWLGVFIVLIIIAFAVWQSLRFHVVSITPSMDQVAAITPRINFNFNQPLDIKSIKVTSSTVVFATPKTSGKTLTIDLTQTLTVGKQYSITLINVASTSGHVLKNKVFTFTAKDIPFSKLPKEQQQAILKNQATQPYTKESITYIGMNELLNSGSSANQIDSLEQAFCNYSKKVNKQFKQVTIDTSSIHFKPTDRNHPSLTTTIYFAVSIDSSIYQATINESGLSTTQLLLYNSSNNTLLYDSGPIDTAGLDTRSD